MPVPETEPEESWGVDAREGEEKRSLAAWVEAGGMKEDGRVNIAGESKTSSSLMPEDEPRGRVGAGGGGVRPLSSVNVSQKSLPLEFFIACCLKLLERPWEISIMSSSGMPSNDSCVGPKLGEEWEVEMEWCRGSRSMSLSRVWRTTSASRRTSVSTGVLSSARAARIRANPFVLGCDVLVFAT